VVQYAYLELTLAAGITTHVSSAYLNIRFLAVTVVRSAALLRLHKIGWANSRSLHYAGCGVKLSGHGAAELCTCVTAARKEVDVDFVGYVGGSHFVEQSGVPNGVKGLTEV